MKTQQECRKGHEGYVLTEHDLDLAIENAHATFSVVAASIPKPLEEKEAHLVDWYSRLKGNPMTKLYALYDFMEQIYGFIHKFTPCKKGCTSCCHYPVTIRDVEIKLIERKTGIPRAKHLQNIENHHGIPCPFLRNNACSIYPSRPFACRRHIAITKTAHWCHPDRANAAKFPLVKFSEVERVFDAILLESESSNVWDIRQVFVAP
jgi:Fe-S-cluster containining protein